MNLNLRSVVFARATCPIWWRATENAQGQIDGFISANSYVSTDGAWVVNYARWRSAEVFLAMLAGAGPASARGRMGPVGDRLGPHPYSVESVHTSNHFSGSEP
jgi:hypothetical protein